MDVEMLSPQFETMLEDARAGDVGAMIKVGNALRNGNKRLAVKRDVNAGLSWLEKAAESGSTEAMRTLVNAYERLCCAGTYFDFSASESADMWKARLLAAEEEISASGARNDPEIVLLGKGKKRISHNAYANRLDLERVEIACTVEEIGSFAFTGCSRLVSVKLPSSLCKIKAGAFYQCEHLRCVEFSNGLKSIEGNAFKGCPLVDLTLPDSLTDVARYAFDDNVVMPERIVREWEKARRHEIEALKAKARRDAERDAERARKIQELREAESMRKAEDEEKSNSEKEASHSAFTEKYGIDWKSVEYSYKPGVDMWAGCRIQRASSEAVSVEIPEKFRSGDTRRLIASIVVRGASKTYSVMLGGDERVEVESYSLQRDARKSRFWPVFDALIAYRKQS
jgi:hypothetical protein